MACYTCGWEGHVARDCRAGAGSRGGGGGGAAAAAARLVANPISAVGSGGGDGMGSLDSHYFDQPALWNFLRLSIVVSTSNIIEMVGAFSR